MRIYLNAELKKKHDAFNTRPFEVNKVIELPMDEYAAFCDDLLEPQSFIKENAAFMTIEEGIHHCLLVMGEGSSDGIRLNSLRSRLLQDIPSSTKHKRFVNPIFFAIPVSSFF